MFWLILRLGALDTTSMADLDDELLVGLSLDELRALAEGILTPTAQAQLKALLTRNLSSACLW
jgi:hypothetical protein